MFGIRSQQPNSYTDPLQSRRSAMTWFGQLPPLEVMARAQIVTEALATLRQAAVPIDRERVSAIGYLEAAVESDLLRLMGWFVENHETSPALAERSWQAAHDLNQGFVHAFQAAIDPAFAGAANSRWKPVLPLLIGELIRCHGIDALLRLFHRQHWIPAKWIQIHTLFRRATELGIERLAATSNSSDPLAPERTIEQEYLHVLLIHQLDTGNLAPPELEWASRALLAWSGDLTLESAARTADGFYVDLRSSSGLIRRSGNDNGTMVGYLDTTPLVQRVEAALVEATAARIGGTEGEVAARQRHIATLEKIRPAIVAARGGDFRRHRRAAMDVIATARIGFPLICQALADSEGTLAGSIANTAEPASGATPPGPKTDKPAARLASRANEPGWRIKDVSAAGWRMTTSVPAAPNLKLGALVAVRRAGAADWMLGVVRRLKGIGKHDLDAGVALVAERVVAVTLHAQQPAQQHTSAVVDSVDSSAIGVRCYGLYPLTPTGVDFAISMRTLIVPTKDYEEGRRLILVTGRSDYAVVLRHLVDQHAEWSWVTMQIVGRTARDA